MYLKDKEKFSKIAEIRLINYDNIFKIIIKKNYVS